VLVTGPTGSGKELVVEAVHTLGPHPDHPLLDVNCGAIPEALMESQLFGHAKGAFTGADREQQGYLTQVKEGTLFLDEVAELPPMLQAKLLRVLETGEVTRVGSLEARPELTATIDRVSPALAAEQLASGEPLAVDVRAPRERDEKFVAGSVNIPLNHLAERLNELPTDRPLLLYCAGGYRSSIAASLLQREGFTQVAEIAGGLAAWETAHLPVAAARSAGL